MSFEYEVGQGLDDLRDAGLIDEVLYQVKGGKEATVFCCRTRGQLAAAKVYRELSTRGFRNSAVYQGGRVHLAREGRARRAAENRSAFGQQMEQALWIDHEWEMLRRLFDAGLDVPQPLARGEHAILMTFLGDAAGPSPMLHVVDFEPEHAAHIVDRLLWNVLAMLDLHVVHGDLSPFNIMWHEQRAVIIDLPQSVDSRLNRAAFDLLLRDVTNICTWAAKHSVKRHASAIAADLWTRFQLGEIG